MVQNYMGCKGRTTSRMEHRRTNSREGKMRKLKDKTPFDLVLPSGKTYYQFLEGSTATEIIKKEKLKTPKPRRIR